MMQSSPCQSDPASALCLVCQALYRWHEHFEEHGTPPEPQDFVALWPGTDLKRLRTLLMVLAYADESKQSDRLGALCDCTVAMRRDYHERMQAKRERVKIAAAEGNGKAVVEVTQNEPVVSVRFARRWRHLAAACIGLVVVLGGVIGWHEHFNAFLSRTFQLSRSGEFSQTLDEREAQTSDWIEESIIVENGQEFVSFDLLEETTEGLLSVSGAERGEPVDAELARGLMRRFYGTVRGLLSKTEEEVLAGLDALYLELDSEPAWAWLKFAAYPPKQLLLRAADPPTDRDKEPRG